MADRQFVAPFGDHAAPADWTLAAALEILPKLAHAKFDGTNAAGSYKPCLRLISDSGHVAAEAVSETIVAAGASADVTWFPGVDDDTGCTCSPQAGVAAQTLYLDSTNSSGVLTTGSLVAGQQYVVIVEGTYSEVNHALDVGTPEAEAMFPDSHVGRVSTQVGFDPDTSFAYYSAVSGHIGHLTNFQISLDGGLTYAHLEPDGGPYATPQSGHLYRYTLTGQGHPAGFLILDSPGAYGDNYGQLRISLQVPSGTGTGSGAGSLVPPSDTTLNGDVLTVVSGVPAWQAASGTGITDLTSSGGTITVANPTGPTANVDLPATGVTPGSYGDGSHVPEITVDAEGRITALATTGVTGGTGTIGFEIGYAQITAPVNVISTTEASPTTIIAPGALTFDGGPVMVEFFSPFVTNPQVANGFVLILLFEGSTEIGRLADIGMTTSSTSFQYNIAAVGRYRFTPTAGVHTYTVGAICNSTTGTPKVGAGAGGTGAYVPAFVRFTKV